MSEMALYVMWFGQNYCSLWQSCRVAGNTGQDAVSHKDVRWVWYEDVISKSNCHLLPIISIQQPVSQSVILLGNVIHTCG
jgi:hypothetical protein